jgi:hypothetical protein
MEGPARPRPARPALPEQPAAVAGAAAGPPPPIPKRTYRRTSARTEEDEAAAPVAVAALPVVEAVPASLVVVQEPSQESVEKVVSSGTTNRVLDLVCKECEFANTAGPLCYSCSSPLEQVELAVDVVVAVPASLRCASCGHMNFLVARECAVCSCSFGQSDSYIQEDVYGGLNLTLSRIEEEEGGAEAEAAMQELLSNAPADDGESSMLAPDFDAPLPVPRGKRQLAMAEYAERLHAALQLPAEDSDEAEQPPLISLQQVQQFVSSAIVTEGWEPALTIKVRFCCISFFVLLITPRLATECSAIRFAELRPR